MPGVTAPFVDADTTLRFRLTVDDGRTPDSDEVVVTVVPLPGASVVATWSGETLWRSGWPAYTGTAETARFSFPQSELNPVDIRSAVG